MKTMGDPLLGKNYELQDLFLTLSQIQLYYTFPNNITMTNGVSL